MSRRPTQQDVARLAGVSRPLVSAVLRGRSDQMRASEETKQRIRQVAAELGYEPDVHPSVRRGGPGLIGLMLWKIRHSAAITDFWVPFLQGVEAGIHAEGCDLLSIGATDREPASERARRYAASGQIDALIVPGFHPPAEYASLVDIDRIPIVGAFPDRPHLAIPWIDVDDAAGIQAACQVCLDYGHERILYLRQIDDPRRYFASHIEPRRFTAYRDFCTERGLEEHVRSVDLRDKPYEPGAAHPLTNPDLLNSVAEVVAPSLAGGAVSAVVCETEPLAFGVYHAAARVGLRIPDELSVVAFDDRHAVTADPPMASVGHMLLEVGEVAGRYAAQAAGRGEVPRGFRRELVEPTVTVRQSMAPPPGSGAHALARSAAAAPESSRGAAGSRDTTAC